MAEPWIRQYVAPGGLGWLLALIVLILCVVALVLGKPAGLSSTELLLIGMLALARLT